MFLLWSDEYFCTHPLKKAMPSSFPLKWSLKALSFLVEVVAWYPSAALISTRRPTKQCDGSTPEICFRLRPFFPPHQYSCGVQDERISNFYPSIHLSIHLIWFIVFLQHKKQKQTSAQVNVLRRLTRSSTKTFISSLALLEKLHICVSFSMVLMLLRYPSPSFLEISSGSNTTPKTKEKDVSVLTISSFFHYVERKTNQESQFFSHLFCCPFTAK